MISFKQFLGENFKQVLKEGGNAVKGTVRINQLNVDKTLADIYSRLLPELGLKKSATSLLGSTGKKDPSKNGLPEGSSGDIDLAVKVSNDIPAFLNQAESAAKTLGYHYKRMDGLGILSIGWPIANIDGKQDNKFVQLDLMPVSNLKYATWAYYSPAYNESPLKGLYRNELMYAVAKFAGMNVTETTPDGDPLEWSRLFFDLGKGLMKGTQSRKGKAGKPIKTVKTLNKSVLSTSPTKIAAFFFGPDVKPDDVLTFENTLKAILSKSFPYKKHVKQILQMAADGIEKKGQPVPKILTKHL